MDANPTEVAMESLIQADEDPIHVGLGHPAMMSIGEQNVNPESLAPEQVARQYEAPHSMQVANDPGGTPENLQPSKPESPALEQDLGQGETLDTTTVNDTEGVPPSSSNLHTLWSRSGGNSESREFLLHVRSSCARACLYRSATNRWTRQTVSYAL